MTRVLIFIVCVALSGCQSSQYQPEGRDLWQSVRVR